MNKALRASLPVLFSVLAFGASAPIAFAASWYVDASVTSSGGGTSTSTAFKTLQEGVAAAQAGNTVNVAAGEYDLTSELDITNPISIVGTGSVTVKSTNAAWSSSAYHLIGINAGSQTTPIAISNITFDSNHQSYGINTYNNAYATLDGVTINNSKGAGLTVNGSTVVATNLNTNTNYWGAVNVDSGSRVTAPSVFTLNSGTLSEGNQIWSDGSNNGANQVGTNYGTVNVPSTYKSYIIAGGAHNGFKIWSNGTPTGATIAGDAMNTLYSTIQAAVTAANSGDTINVGAGTYNETVSISKALTLNGAQAGVVGKNHSGAESTTTAMNVSANNVTVDGFAFSNAGVQMDISTSTAILSGVAIKNNVFSGYGSVGVPTENAGNLLVSGNSFKNPLASTESMQIKANTSGGCNGTVVSNNVFIGATNNNGADVNLSCTDSNSSNITVSGNTSTGNGGGSSFVAFSGVNGGIIVSNNVATTDGSSVYFFGDVTGTATIENNAITNGGGSAISVHGAGDAGTPSSADTGTFLITGNTLTGNHRAVYLSSAALGTGGSVSVHNNTITGNTTAGIENATSTAIDASQNWWGNASGPSGSDTVGTVTTAPWYTDAGMTTLYNGTPVVSGGEASTTISVPVTQTGTLGATTVTAEISQGTVVTAASSTWNGTIQSPTAVSSAGSTAPAGFSVAGTVIEVGSPDVTLTFSNPVKITLPGVTGPVGYKAAGSDTWTPITTQCVSDSDSSNITTGECYYATGGNTVIWTYHYTTFGQLSLNQPVISPNGGDFIGNMKVTMDDSSGGATIHYTTDASTPSCSSTAYTNGETLTFNSETTLKAIRCDANGNYSSVSTASFRPVSSGGGGVSGGGGSIAVPATPATPAVPMVSPAVPATPATPAQGRVLGAATFNFTKALSVGVRSNEVTELQKVLIAEGFLKIDAPTGYFGKLTRTAVIAFQKARGIAQVGVVGPLTRAELNKGK